MTRPFHTRTFKSGNSVAVRLPKGFDIPEGVEVELARIGNAVTIKLAKEPDAERARMRAWLDELQSLPKPGEIEEREPIVFPKRPGL